MPTGLVLPEDHKKEVFLVVGALGLLEKVEQQRRL